MFNQFPNAATPANVGSVVSFKVAQNVLVPTVQVPNLIGMTPGQAAAALAAVQLVSNGTIDFKFGKPLHRVYSQGKNPFTLVPKGSIVSWRANP